MFQCLLFWIQQSTVLESTQQFIRFTCSGSAFNTLVVSRDKMTAPSNSKRGIVCFLIGDTLVLLATNLRDATITVYHSDVHDSSVGSLWCIAKSVELYINLWKPWVRIASRYSDMSQWLQFFEYQVPSFVHFSSEWLIPVEFLTALNLKQYLQLNDERTKKS